MEVPPSMLGDIPGSRETESVKSPVSSSSVIWTTIGYAPGGAKTILDIDELSGTSTTIVSPLLVSGGGSAGKKDASPSRTSMFSSNFLY